MNHRAQRFAPLVADGALYTFLDGGELFLGAEDQCLQSFKISESSVTTSLHVRNHHAEAYLKQQEALAQAEDFARVRCRIDRELVNVGESVQVSTKMEGQREPYAVVRDLQRWDRNLADFLS
ncbi:hypothetical protein HDU86_002334 [Geranomyces michiganensis]|nr:hypothetical protein HDU86_002334 [Geranomyces michiganensis]